MAKGWCSDRRSMIFSDDEVRNCSEAREDKQPWSVFESTKEIHEGYMLRLASRRSHLFMPRRAFASTTDEETFREQVKRHTEAQLRGA
jgi:hypothetical protein